MNKVELEMAVSDVPDMLKPAARQMLIRTNIDLAPLRAGIEKAEAENNGDMAQGLRKVLSFAEELNRRAARAIDVLTGKSPSRSLTPTELNGIFGADIDHSDSILPHLVQVAIQRLESIRKTYAENTGSLPPESPANVYVKALRDATHAEVSELERVVQRGLYAYAIMGNRV